MKPPVICLPGGVAPAAQRYAPLNAAIGETVELHLKDLEVYRDAAPPADYSVNLELSGIDGFADSLGLDRFHLVGYSGGGFVPLAYAGTRSRRLLSLGLFEPAMVPGQMTGEEQSVMATLKAKLEGLTGSEFMSAFVREQLKPGVHVTPVSGPFPPELQNRPAGIGAMMRAFLAFEFDRTALRDVGFPVYRGYGDLTHEVEVVKAGVLARWFGDIRIQRYPGIHHFVPPDQIYTPAHAKSLEELWRRSETGVLSPQLSL